MKLNKTNTLIWCIIIPIIMIFGVYFYGKTLVTFFTDIDQKESNGLVKGDSVRHGKSQYIVIDVDSSGNGRIYGNTFVTSKAKVK